MFVHNGHVAGCVDGWDGKGSGVLARLTGLRDRLDLIPRSCAG